MSGGIVSNCSSPIIARISVVDSKDFIIVNDGNERYSGQYCQRNCLLPPYVSHCSSRCSLHCSYDVDSMFCFAKGSPSRVHRHNGNNNCGTNPCG